MKKVWWTCAKCGYKWKATDRNRVNGVGCPACANRVATPKNCLTATHLELAKEFHLTKNAPLTPDEVVGGSNKKVWWSCLKCGFEWRAVINSRVQGCGCPACANRVATPKNCLTATHPELAKEFHLTKNAPFTPDEVVAGSSKKVWWRCAKPECAYEWNMSVKSRSRGSGCPKCREKSYNKT